MCLKVVQLRENGETVGIWPDFGRFYAERITRLLDRMYHDREYGQGVLRAFGEDAHTSFLRLNDRLRLIDSVFWVGVSTNGSTPPAWWFLRVSSTSRASPCDDEDGARFRSRTVAITDRLAKSQWSKGNHVARWDHAL